MAGIGNLGQGRYDISPLRIFDIGTGETGTLLSHSFDKSQDVDFGKYGFPNQIQVRNNTTNKLRLTVNHTYVFQVPALFFETYNFEEEGIKHMKLENLEETGTDDLIQIVAVKEITQNMVNKLLYYQLGGGL